MWSTVDHHEQDHLLLKDNIASETASEQVPFRGSAGGRNHPILACWIRYRMIGLQFWNQDLSKRCQGIFVVLESAALSTCTYHTHARITLAGMSKWPWCLPYRIKSTYVCISNIDVCFSTTDVLDS
jgi:hypothetical protein